MRRAGLALVLLATLLLGLPAAADASNRRIAISDYQWSDDQLNLDLGEHVTWYWIGPDTLHSVTGDSPNSEGLDSDPNRGQPEHVVGDSFRLDFNSPGTYKFRCKIHSLVKGTVTVSGNPGDPNSEPDPVPQGKVDKTPPELRQVRLNKSVIGRRGTNLKFSLGESSRISADIYSVDKRGRLRFEGYRTWSSHIGWNGVRFGDRSKHFHARPGRYVAKLTAIDKSANSSKVKQVKFTIRQPSKGAG